MKENFRQKIWISFGIVFASFVFAAVGLYFLSGQLAAEAQKIIADKALTAKQAEAVSAFANLKRDAPIAARYETAIKRLLPPHDDLISFPQWLTNLAHAHNVTVSSAFRGDITPAGDSAPGTDGFSLTAAGILGNLAAFLEDIEARSPGFLLVIDSVDLASTGGNYTLSVQGKLFSQ